MKVVILPNDSKTTEENIRSAMTRIGGIPVFFHTVMLFRKYGFKDFMICDNSKTHEIRDYLNENLDKIEDISIRLFKLPPCLKSGKILELCSKKGLENTFFVAPNDVITDLNLQKMLFFHRQNGRAATVCIAENKKYFNALSQNGSEKYESKIVNSGFYVFEEEAIDYIDGNACLDRQPLIAMAESDELSVYSDKHLFQRCSAN